MVTYAYVAAALDYSLTLLNVTNPAAPSYNSSIRGAGTPNFLGAITDVYKEGDYCYCGCGGTAIDLSGDACLTIINVSNPAAPSFSSTLPVGAGTSFRSVFVSGNYAYVSDQTKGLYLVDISNPLIPSITGSILFAALGLSATARIGRAYKPTGNYAYIQSEDGSGLVDNDNALLVIDVSTPAAPTLAGSIRGVANFVGGSFVFASGSYCYLASSVNSALTIIDITNPAAPALTGKITGSGNPNYLDTCYFLYKDGNYCYCGTSDGITIINVTTPATPSFTSNLGTLTPPLVVYKSGSYLYVSEYSINQVDIIDVSNVLAPTVTGSISGAGTPNYLSVPYFIATGGYPPTPPSAPTVTSVTPAYGSVEGGTSITVIGTGFVATPTITIGGRSCTGVTFVSATEVTAVTPSGKNGDRDVVITNPDFQTGTLTKGFKYLHSKAKCCVASYVMGKICPNGIMRFR
jgi:hypothetical protein